MRTYKVSWAHHIPQYVKNVLKTLEEAGFQALIAGGAVRDLWLGLGPKDFDLASNASPDEIEKLFPKTIAVGKAFGIIVVVTDKIGRAHV